MAVAVRHVLHGIQTPTPFISQIENARPAPGINVLVAGGAGFQYPLFTGNQGQRPEITFDCTQVKTLLDVCGISLYNMTGGNTDLYFKKVAYMASRVADATTEHVRLRAAEAGLLINSITASHQGEASANCRLFALWDGSNEPLVPAGSVALAGTPTSAEHFGAGPVYVNTVRVPGIQNISIDFGRSMIETGGDSELYDTFAAEGSLAPVITIVTTDIAWTTYGLNGTALTALSVYLRKKGVTSYVANGTAEHIKFTATAGLVTIDDTPAGGNDPQTATIRITLAAPTAAGSPITIASTAVAITT